MCDALILVAHEEFPSTLTDPKRLPPTLLKLCFLQWCSHYNLFFSIESLYSLYMSCGQQHIQVHVNAVHVDELPACDGPAGVHEVPAVLFPSGFDILSSSLIMPNH